MRSEYLLVATTHYRIIICRMQLKVFSGKFTWQFGLLATSDIFEILLALEFWLILSSTEQLILFCPLSFFSLQRATFSIRMENFCYSNCCYYTPKA